MRMQRDLVRYLHGEIKENHKQWGHYQARANGDVPSTSPLYDRERVYECSGVNQGLRMALDWVYKYRHQYVGMLTTYGALEIMSNPAESREGR